MNRQACLGWGVSQSARKRNQYFTVASNVYMMMLRYTQSSAMRTNIEIDDTLLAEAMQATGQSTKRGTVEEALRRVVASNRRLLAIQDMAGLGWEGDLATMRSGRNT